MRLVANRQPFVDLFARRFSFKETMDAESSEVLGGFGNVGGGV